MSKVTVDAISDVICPWCFLGGEYLFSAIAAVPELEVQVRWRPFQLDPNIPGEGVARASYMLSKFGDAEKMAEVESTLVDVGRSVGVRYAFDDIEIVPNTLDAHRLILWAGLGGYAGQNRIVRALFSAYFEHGVDIGDLDALASIAAAQGFDGGDAAAFLHSEAGVKNILSEIEAAHRIGVKGVPFFLLNGKYSVFGAQPVDMLVEALREAGNAAA